MLDRTQQLVQHRCVSAFANLRATRDRNGKEVAHETAKQVARDVAGLMHVTRYVEHCDVVIAVRRPYLRVIGGNTRDSVMLTSLPMDNRDRPLPVAGRSWMVAVENRGY